jgi:hypothetical protein
VVFDTHAHRVAEGACGHHGEAKQTEAAQCLGAPDAESEAWFADCLQGAAHHHARLPIRDTQCRIAELAPIQAESGKPVIAGNPA